MDKHLGHSAAGGGGGGYVVLVGQNYLPVLLFAVATFID